jgi:hypothetical protein
MFTFYKKIIFLFFVTTFTINAAYAQLFKRLKDEAKWKLEQKAKEKMNQTIDKTVDKAVDSIGSKKKKSKFKKTETNTNEENNLNDAGVKKDIKHPQNNDESFIELRASSPIAFTGGVLTLSGRSISYKDFKNIKIKITGIENYEQEKSITLDIEGSYTCLWYVPGLEGEYTITATSSDNKSTAVKIITVYETPDLENMADENINETKKILKKVEERVNKVNPMISSQQANELDEKLKLLKNKVNAAIKLFQSINTANKNLAAMIGKGKPIPKNLSGNLSQMNDILYQQAEDLKNQQEFLNHQPFDNTICEYLVMISEACAAFSTFSALWEKTLGAVIQNIVLDKAPPMVVGAVNTIAGKPIPEPADFLPKEAAKLYVTAKVDMASLKTIKGKAGMAGDLISFVTDVLLKMFCGTYTGEMTQTFHFDYKNKGTSWWKYGGELKATLNLRYPKSGNTGRIIKMKGSLEGNATRFSFWANPKEAVAEELKTAYNSTQVITIADIKAPVIPFASAQADKAAGFGFGAVARTAATPASFYIPIDAEYNLDTKQIKIFINDAIWDFSLFTKNRKVFVVIAALPLFKVQDFPIEKAQKLLHGSLKEKNWFTVTGEDSGKPQFEGAIKRKVNNAEFTIDLSIMMKAEKD